MSAQTPPSARVKRYLARTPWVPVALGATAVVAVAAIWGWYTSAGKSADPDRLSRDADTSEIKQPGATCGTSQSTRNKSRRVLAVVVSAEAGTTDASSDASPDPVTAETILDALPRINPDSTRLVIVIYAPRAHGEGRDAVRAPGSVDLGPETASKTDMARLLSVGTRAAALVERDEMVMTFSSAGAYVHMLRHLAPAAVLLQGSPELLGPAARNVLQLDGWVGRIDVISRDPLDWKEGGPGVASIALDELGTAWAKKVGLK